MYLGIAFISGCKSVGSAGVYGSIIGCTYILVVSAFCTYLLLKARNRFKNREVIDLADLARLLFGETACKILGFLIVVANSCFLIIYCMFIGFNMDQLMCKTWEYAECRNNNLYVGIILILLAPAYCQRTLKNVGFFSAFVLAFTLVGLIVILYVCRGIITEKQKAGTLDEQISVDWAYIPVFISMMNSLFEGNQQILNVYAETDKPQNFVRTAFITIGFLMTCVAIPISFIGIIAFGNDMESVIIYNLPYHDTLSIITRICFVMTISGSFVLLCQPVFHVIESTTFYTTGKFTSEPSQIYDADNEENDFAHKIFEEWSTQRWVKHILVRCFTSFTLWFISTVIPNLHIFLTLVGGLTGTIINVWIPVIFYNRAYNASEKNISKESAKQPLMGDGGEEAKDNRALIKQLSWVVFMTGTFTGAIGIYHAI